MNSKKAFFLLVMPVAIFCMMLAYSLLLGNDTSIGGNSLPTPCPVDTTFYDFYYTHGGGDVFGPALSCASIEENRKIQVFSTVIMVEGVHGDIYLKSLGQEFVEPQMTSPGLAEEGDIVIEGYPVDGDFLHLLTSIGLGNVGKPLTGKIYVEQYNRIEQYFERVGFYKNLSTNEVGLMDYGQAVCDYDCRQSEVELAAPKLPSVVEFTPPPVFEEIMAAWGADFTGDLLVEPYFIEDGRQLAIFENIVVQYSPETGEYAALPIAEQMGYAKQPEYECASKAEFAEYCIDIDDDGWGYLIFPDVEAYLRNHGVPGSTGLPITNPYTDPVTGNDMQCFSGVCLEMIKTESGRVIQPILLGSMYKSIAYDSLNP